MRGIYQGAKKGETKIIMRFWTRQVPEVLKELQETGVYRVKREYIEKKNDTIADFYIELYEWYTREARHYIEIPSELKYPVWLSTSEDNMLQPVENTVILELEIPEENYLVCSMERWGYRVNYWYVPLDTEDEEKHKQELKRLCIAAEDDLILTDKGNFYLLLRRKIIGSWQRVFTMPPLNKQDEVGSAWEIRREWVKSRN